MQSDSISSTGESSSRWTPVNAGGAVKPHPTAVQARVIQFEPRPLPPSLRINPDQHHAGTNTQPHGEHHHHQHQYSAPIINNNGLLKLRLNFGMNPSTVDEDDEQLVHKKLKKSKGLIPEGGNFQGAKRHVVAGIDVIEDHAPGHLQMEACPIIIYQIATKTWHQLECTICRSNVKTQPGKPFFGGIHGLRQHMRRMHKDDTRYVDVTSSSPRLSEFFVGNLTESQAQAIAADVDLVERLLSGTRVTGKPQPIRPASLPRRPLAVSPSEGAETPPPPKPAKIKAQKQTPGSAPRSQAPSTATTPDIQYIPIASVNPHMREWRPRFSLAHGPGFYESVSGGSENGVIDKTMPDG